MNSAPADGPSPMARGLSIARSLLSIARSLLPFAALAAVIAVGLWTFVAFGHVFPQSGMIQRFLATLVTFAGGYLPPAEGPDTTPPTAIAVPSAVAFAITFLAAASVVFVMSRRARNAVRVWRARPHLVVIGSGETAAAILHSAVAHGIETVLVAETEESVAGRIAQGAVPLLTVPNLETAGPGLVRLLKNSENVVVASESASENLRLRGILRSHRPTGSDVDEFRSLLAVVHDPHLAEVLRPTTLAGSFPEEDVTCPAENVAEHLCHLIDAAATGDRVIAKDTTVRLLVTRVVVQIVDVAATPYDAPGTALWDHLAETIELWVRRSAWGRLFLQGDERADHTFNPLAPVEVIDGSGPLPTANTVTIRIYAGSPTAAVTAAVGDRIAHPTDLADLTIVVADLATARAATGLVPGSGLVSAGAGGAAPPVPTGREWLAAGAPMPTAAAGADRQPSARTHV
ncbi:MAG: hypothetical protein QM662_06520, partial [Gordonia sp. (in: high G+C Gram-positive bacteria)]